MQAERTGISFALMWALSMSHQMENQLRVDSLCAVNQASGDWKLQVADTLAYTCKSLAHAAEAVQAVTWADFGHVKGHCGHPWNEMADVLAKLAARDGTTLDFTS